MDEQEDTITSDPEGKSYQQAVLNIRTPVSVTLAERKISLDAILALVPGSMLTFDTHCDQPLTLRAGNHPIATGETVKIGDKFGLRIRQVGTSGED